MYRRRYSGQAGEQRGGDQLSRHRYLLSLVIATALALAFVPTAEASHNNKGTIKVHDDETVDPETRNQPHVSCDFWIEGFKMGDDSGWLVFLDWPPTGNKSEVTPTGDDLEWEADSGEEAGDFHFLKGPYQLPEGHYRVEAYTDDGHPGGRGHFAKAKMFWVEPCEENPPERPDCPTDLNARATSEEGPQNELDWSAVTDADEYRVYRAVEGGDFEFLASTTGTSYADTDVEVGVTYEYTVTAVIDGFESENCDVVEVTAVPFFGAPLLGAIALVGAIGAVQYFRRK